jgi:hypothetical protein
VRRPSGGRLDVEDAEALGERLPVRESTSANRGGCKTLTDLLGPLERFLQSRLNRPWDDVLSEVHAVIKPGHALQRHLLEHLERLVDTRVEWVEGVLCAHRYQLLPLRSGAFYVDPRTGRLRRFEQRRR